MPIKHQILVPKKVSFNPNSKKGYQTHGTKAFVESGTKIPKLLSRSERHKSLRRIANLSSHYIKPLGQRGRRIRGLLKKAEILVEKEIQDLHNGTALFEREGFGLDSPEGEVLLFQNPEKAIERILNIVTAMHSLGITHNHLHMGNFAITDKHEIILLDLGKATISKFPEKPKKGWALKKFGNDLSTITRNVSLIYTSKAGTFFAIDELQKIHAMLIAEIIGHYSPALRQKVMIDFKELINLPMRL
ncbi:MAG: hypothetical protein Q7K42_01945 [Candidatus Diapherotrites archaeon]|nr:hypothetical protein [Candidatus Diapherotrites archaeon]